MIEGMEILKTTELVETNALTLFAGVAVLFMSALISMILAIFYYCWREYLGGILLTALAVGLWVLLCITFNQPVKETPTGVYEYEVVCHTNDAFVEMYKNYDIVSENDDYEDVIGIIYTIRDKEN